MTNFLVEAADPKRGRERKALVRRWIVLAESGQRAIDAVVAELIGDICDAKDGPETRSLVGDRFRAESRWTASPAPPVYRLRNELR